jgi:hypothetical protein
MSDDLQVQAQMGTQLVTALDNIVTTSSDASKLFNSQLDISNELQNAVFKLSNNFQSISNSLCRATANFNEIVNSNSFKKIFKTSSQEINNSCKKAVDALEESSSTIEKLSNEEDKLAEKRNKQTREKRKAYKQSIVAYKEKVAFLRGLDKAFQVTSDSMRSLTKKFKESPLVKRAIKTSGWSLIIDIPRMIIVNAFKVVGSLIGATANFFKTVMSLPLMVANIAVKLGNAFRTDIIEGIGGAHQATREYSDANSLIGKGITNLRNITVGALKTFENPRSQLVKLFGSGAAGAQKFLSDVAKSVDEMGPLAELFGHQVTNSKESALYLVYAKRSLGLSSKDIAYYALDAGTHLESIHSRLDSVRESVESAAKEHSVDTKQVSLGMQKLRVNIKDFGHLTDQSLANLVARMRQSNVGAEDLISVFGKFKTFEDASKTSAMLFQSFQMNIDALDLITAKDPGEIVDRLRDSMFATGKSYEELNRHEKQLMQQTTGMTDAMLKSLMTYQNMGLSYEEAKQRVANDDPTKQQIKAIKGLTSSISEIQKVMNFTSPFQAFMKGLGKNIHSSKKAKEMAVSLSGMYETIYLFGLHLDKNVIKQATIPFLTIVRKIDEVFKSEKFKNILKSGTEMFASVVSHVSGDMHTNTAYKDMIKSLDNIHAMGKTPSVDFKKHQQEIKDKALKLIKGENNKEVMTFLKKKNVLTKDGDFIKGITTEAILSQLKSASLEMSSTNGKDAIGNINKGVTNHVDGLLAEYLNYREFETHTGVRGQIKRTTEGFKKMFDEGGGPLKAMFDLGRKLMGGIIKGAAIGLTVFLRILNGTVDKFYDKASGPITGLVKEAIGHKEGQEFSILNWLGISADDKEGIETSLISSLRGLVKTGATVFMTGLGIGSKLYGMFGDLAMFLMSKLAQVIYTFWLASNIGMKTLMNRGMEMGKIKEAAFMTASDGGLGAIVRLSGTLAADDKKNWFQSLQMTSSSIHAIGDQLQNRYSKIPYTPYGSYIRENNRYENDELNTAFFSIVGDQEELEYRRVMKALEGIMMEKTLESYLSANEFMRIQSILSNEISVNPDVLEFYKSQLEFVAGNDALAVRQQTKLTGSYSTEDKNKNMIELAKKASKLAKAKPRFTAESFIKAYPYPIQDGTFEQLNSMLSGGGFKLFTEDGKVIIPHNLDELATISEGNTGSLIDLFSSAANAYKQAATAVTIMNSGGGINRSKDEYEASGEVIDKMMNLVYDTLDICINRDIKVNKQVTW